MHISNVSVQVVLIFKKLCANPTRELPRLTTLVHVPNVPRQVAFALEDTGAHIAWEILDVTDSMDHRDSAAVAVVRGRASSSPGFR